MEMNDPDAWKVCSVGMRCTKHLVQEIKILHVSIVE